MDPSCNGNTKDIRVNRWWIHNKCHFLEIIIFLSIDEYLDRILFLYILFSSPDPSIDIDINIL